MDVRQNNGQAFENFRTALAREMRTLRGIAEPVERARRIQDLSHEFATSQVQEVDAAVRRIRGELAIEGIGGIASLAAIVPASAGPAGFFGLLGSVFTGVLTLKKYVSDIKGHPGYFLWRLKKAGQRQAQRADARGGETPEPTRVNVRGFSPRSIAGVDDDTKQ
jgi:hypothetical protein